MSLVEILNRIFTTYTFRFMFSYVAVLGVAVFVLLAIVYGFYSYGQFVHYDEKLGEELSKLQQKYEQKGLSGVELYIAQRSRLNRFFYLLVDKKGKRLAGDFESMPSYREFGDDWLSFEWDVLLRDGESMDHADFIARSAVQSDGTRLLVALHYTELLQNAEVMASMMLRGMLIMIVLGVLGGAWTSLVMLREVESVNKGIRKIMDGNLDERIPITGRGGDMERLVSNMNDMLDRIQLLMNGVRDVADNIAHDLRTPLTRMRHHIADVRRNAAPENKQALAAILEEADSLLVTFNALLRIAQVESGNRRTHFTKVNIKQIIEDVVELYEPVAAEKQQTLLVDLAYVGDISGDRDLLFQAIVNLVDNAIKYTPENKTITVSLLSGEKNIQLFVVDQGPGIMPDKRDKVFNRFFRIEGSRHQPGNGLGLSLVKAVVHLHRGEIKLLDNHPGLKVGITFPC